MKRFNFLWIILLPIQLLAIDITINGSVVNASNSKPVAGAKVFINRTTSFVLTNDAGNFLLNNVKDTDVELVVYYPGFQTLVYNISSEKPVLNIRFEIVEIKKDHLIGDSNFNAQQEQLFIDYFIGKSFNAAETHIINPEVLRYKFNISTGLLEVSAVDMLNILNDGLGYFINYQLELFELNINSGLADLQGYCFFKELSSQKTVINQKWIERRLITYDGSFLHFTRTLFNNRLLAEGFHIRNVSRILEDQKNYKDALKSKNYLRSGTLDLTGKIISFVDQADIEELPPAKYRSKILESNRINFNTLKPVIIDFKSTNQYINSIANIDNKPQKSILYLTSGGVDIQQNGLFFPTDNLLIEGAMREQIADLLPINYYP